MLFDIWIKYKPQLPDWIYNEKLLKVGDLLIQIKVSPYKIKKGSILNLFVSLCVSVQF